MLIISENVISGITSLSDINDKFPLSNLTDKHIKKVCKSNNGVLGVEIKTKSSYNAVAIFNTNADLVSVNLQETLNLGSIYESVGQSVRHKNKLYLFDGLNSGDLILSFQGHENVEVGLIFVGVIKKYGFTLWESKDSIVDASKIEESVNGSALVVNRGFRVDKTFKVSSTYSEFVSLMQLLESKRNSNNPFMVFASYDRMQLDSFTHLKYGYAKMPTNIEENPARVTYDLEVKGSI